MLAWEKCLSSLWNQKIYTSTTKLLDAYPLHICAMHKLNYLNIQFLSKSVIKYKHNIWLFILLFLVKRPQRAAHCVHLPCEYLKTLRMPVFMASSCSWHSSWLTWQPLYLLPWIIIIMRDWKNAADTGTQ